MEMAKEETVELAVNAKSKYSIYLFQAWCKQCEICVEFCPQKVFTIGQEGYPEITNPDVCTGCNWCVLHCPDFAITIQKREIKPEELKEKEKESGPTTAIDAGE